MAIIGWGSDFQMSTDGGITFTSIGSVIDGTLPEPDTTDVKTSNLQMAQPWHQYIPGLVEPGSGKKKLIFDKTKMVTIFNNIRTARVFRFVYSDLNVTASTYVFSGYYKTVPAGTIPLDDLVVCELVIKASGIPTFTAGT